MKQTAEGGLVLDHMRADDNGMAQATQSGLQPQIPNLIEQMTSADRKMYPVKTGVIDYFRDALLRIAKVSFDGNNKHNPGEPLHWARGKSDDHADCAARHMFCDHDEEHRANEAWRSLAKLQLFLEKKYNIKPPVGCK